MTDGITVATGGVMVASCNAGVVTLFVDRPLPSSDLALTVLFGMVCLFVSIQYLRLNLEFKKARVLYCYALGLLLLVIAFLTLAKY